MKSIINYTVTRFHNLHALDIIYRFSVLCWLCCGLAFSNLHRWSGRYQAFGWKSFFTVLVIWRIKRTAVSNLFGVIEIITGLLLLFSLKYDVLRPFAAFCLIATFLITFSFLFTTPGMWNTVDGVLVTNFMILKDIPMLGLGFTYLKTKDVWKMLF